MIPLSSVILFYTLIDIHVHVCEDMHVCRIDLFWLTVGIPSSDIENLIFVSCYVFSLRHINMNAIVEYFISHHILAN
jgi:hypothetical protein